MGRGRVWALSVAVVAFAGSACGGSNKGPPASTAANASDDDMTEPAAGTASADPGIASLGPSPTPAPPVTVSFTQGALGAGTSRVLRIWIGRRMLFAVDRGAAPVTVEHVSGELDERREDVMAAVDGAPTKVKVTFLHKESTVVENGFEKTRQSVVAGKSYVIEAKDGTLYITTDTGRRVSQAEGDVIAQGYDDLGQANGTLGSLPARPIAVGENADGLVQGIVSAIDRGAEGHVGFGATSATLRGTRTVGGQTCGVFGVHMQVAYKLDKVESRSDLTGELVVRTSDTQPVSMSLHGPVVMGGETAHANVEGQGETRLEATWTQP